MKVIVVVVVVFSFPGSDVRCSEGLRWGVVFTTIAELQISEQGSNKKKNYTSHLPAFLGKQIAM